MRLLKSVKNYDTRDFRTITTMKYDVIEQKDYYYNDIFNTMTSSMQ